MISCSYGSFFVKWLWLEGARAERDIANLRGYRMVNHLHVVLLFFLFLVVSVSKLLLVEATLEDVIIIKTT